MRVAEPVKASWHAELALDFIAQDGKTVLARRRHDGPLVVQKPFYPEGDTVCHAIVVHPPGGIAAGDELELRATVGSGAHALLTTPGAAKWYRSAGTLAKQTIGFEVEGTLEWLPQETIVFDGARAEMKCEVALAPGARYVGWEILCLGRTGSDERYTRGNLRIETRVSRQGKPIWIERGRMEGGGEIMASPAGLAGRSVCATLVACAEEFDDSLVAECRALPELSVTRLPGVLVARHLGDSSEQAKRRLTRLWHLIRPALAGREAVEPRIWRT
jgi:urease accessory protein